MIKSVIFPLGKLRAATKEEITKELDLYLYENKIVREKIITIQYSLSHGHFVLLVYEMREP